VAKVLTSTAVHPKGVKRDDHYGAGIVRADLALKKTGTSFGGLSLGLTALMGLFALAWVGRPRLGSLSVAGVLAGVFVAGGFSFVPAFLGLASVAPFFGGLSSLDGLLFGAMTPVFHSILPLVLLAGLLYGVRRLRSLLFGFAAALAAKLFFLGAYAIKDLSAMPDVLDGPFLLVNALCALAIAVVVVPRRNQ
jgi:hypothetical protein